MRKWIFPVLVAILLILAVNPPYRMTQSGEHAYMYNVYTGKVWHFYGLFKYKTQWHEPQDPVKKAKTGWDAAREDLENKGWDPEPKKLRPLNEIKKMRQGTDSTQ